MHKKNIFSRSRGYRLWMERLEERSMLAADVDAGFDDFSFDWSQFDDAAWADCSQFDDSAWGDWSQFDDSAWSDPVIVDGSFVEQPPEGELSWIFEQDGSDPAPAEPEAPLPEAVADDPTATPEDVWQTTVVETTDSSGTEPIVTDPIVDDTTVDAEIDEVIPVEPPVLEDPVAETVTDPPLPVEPEPTTSESPLTSDPSIIEADSDGWVWQGQDDTYDWSDWSDETNWSDETEVAELETGVSDEMQPQDGEDPLPEDMVAFDPDSPVQTAVPSVNTTANANGPRQTGFSARAAAFSTMRMFPGFSFGGSTDSSDDGPIFAGGRRRSRR